MQGGGRQQGLIFAAERDAGHRLGWFVVQQHKAPDRVHAAPDLLQDRQELAVDQQDIVFGMVDGVEDLLRREAHVDGMQHRPDHRHGEEALQVAMGVPVHDRHRIARLHPLGYQGIGQPPDPLVQVAIGIAEGPAVDDLLLRGVHHWAEEQVFDQQGVVIGGRGTWDRRMGHGSGPPDGARISGRAPVVARTARTSNTEKAAPVSRGGFSKLEMVFCTT